MASIDADERLARVALATLPSMFPRRLAAVLGHHTGVEALSLLRRRGRLADDLGFVPAALHALAVQARSCDVDKVIDACEAAEIDVVVRGEDSYPTRLESDAEAPEVLFVRGDPALCERRTVAIVGTRRATAAGRATAAELGRGLAARGVAVVSGLATGIDAASHRDLHQIEGAAAVAVVGSGLDVPYPRSNQALWESVGKHGVLISEWGPGVAPEAWHFPLRNRIIAGLAEVLVVVESRESGGSLITARAALDRGIDVLAVPGSVHCRAATGTNRLIADGAGVVCSVDDVICALDLISPLATRRASPPPQPTSLAGHPPLATEVYRLCLDRPRTLDQLVEATDAGLLEVASAAVALEHDGLLADSNGWLEAVGSRLLSALVAEGG